MGFTPGIWSGINASISHNQRINKKNEEKTTYRINTTKVMTNHEPITSPKEILEELKLVIEQENNKDEHSICVYDVINLVRNKYKYCQSLDLNLIYSISDLTNLDYLFLNIDFDCKNKYLIVSYHCNKMFFTKQNNDLILVKSKYYNAQDILGKCGKEISERYDKFIDDISFYRDYMNNVQSTNSKFKINSDEYTIDVKYDDSFKLKALTYRNEYEYKCNSNNVASVCRYNEDEIFKKIFVKIEDCPKWTQKTLYEYRKQQLEQQSIIEYNAIKKKKRKEFIKKLNPFKNK